MHCVGSIVQHTYKKIQQKHAGCINYIYDRKLILMSDWVKSI